MIQVTCFSLYLKSENASKIALFFYQPIVVVKAISFDKYINHSPLYFQWFWNYYDISVHLLHLSIQKE